MPDNQPFEPNWAELPGNDEPAVDELAALLGDLDAALAPAPVVTPVVSPLPPADVVLAQGGPAWDSALHLLPAWGRQLVGRYPAIGIAMREGHGRVLLAAYLEDTVNGVRRNLKIGDDIFHYADAIDKLEPDTKHLGCRIVLKTLAYRVGTTLRYWENTRQGDSVGKSGSFTLGEQGLRRTGAAKGSR